MREVHYTLLHLSYEKREFHYTGKTSILQAKMLAEKEGPINKGPSPVATCSTVTWPFGIGAVQERGTREDGAWLPVCPFPEVCSQSPLCLLAAQRGTR